jgi:hypothetical protein
VKITRRITITVITLAASVVLAVGAASASSTTDHPASSSVTVADSTWAVQEPVQITTMDSTW